MDDGDAPVPERADGAPFPERAERDEGPGPVDFEQATAPRPAPTGIRVFTWVVLGIIAAAVVSLVVVMLVAVGR